MIITCERCATRFKVPDDKLAAGAVRMRCSKCNHVFLAGPAAVAEGAAPPAPGFDPSPTATVSSSTLPPVFGAPRAPSVPAPVSGAVAVFGAPRLRSKDPFANLGIPAPPPAAANAPMPFSSSSSAPRRTLPDPFTNLGMTSATPPPASDPFASLPPRSAVDPFALPASSTRLEHGPFAVPAASVRAPTDPFASMPPRAGPDPFSGLSAPSPSRTSNTAAPTADPFAGLPAAKSATPDPFAAAMTPAPAPFIAGDPFAGLTSSPSVPAPRPQPLSARPDPFGSFAPPPAPVDPFAPAQPPSLRPDPFGSFGPPPAAAVDPFALSTPPPPAAPPGTDPFAAAMSSSSPLAPIDPFAPVTAPPRSAFDDHDPFAAPPPAPRQQTMPPTPSMPPPPGDDDDLFGRLDDVHIAGAPSGPSYDANARASLFGGASPTPPTRTSSGAAFAAPPLPSSAPSGLELATPTRSTLPSPSVSTTTRALPALRAASAVLQVLLFIGMVVVAIVLGRGGSPAALLAGDSDGSFSPAAAEGPLRIDSVDVTRRFSTSGMPLLVVTGSVHHGGDDAFDGVIIDVFVDDVVIASGSAWSDVDAFTIAAVANPEDLQVVQAHRPKAPRVTPGDDATFVVVAAAPAAEASVRVVARPTPIAP